MGAEQYMNEVSLLLERLRGQRETIDVVAEKASEVIKSGNWVRMFGSGHSILPIMDTFPRYGGYVGFYPIMDPRLMWTTASGPGGAEEVIWMERQEGYSKYILRSTKWCPEDMLIVISHGGQNPAPVEMAQAAKDDHVLSNKERNRHRSLCIHRSG